MLQQIEIFEDYSGDLESPVNISKVKHLSPFRYPGGKTWLVPYFVNYFNQRQTKCSNFVEAFAGGAIIGLTIASRNLTDKLTINELDPEVSAVWETIFSEDYEYLIKSILEFDLTHENVKEYLEKSNKSTPELAFQTILKNRTYHGGIMAAGSGLLKNGENGKGIKSRWYAKTLAQRITHLNSLKSKVAVLNEDALCYLENFDQKSGFAFIDPPYTAPGKRAGKRLYNFHELDHERLFEICAKKNFDFMMTYDENDYVLEMSESNNFCVEKIAMKNTHHKKMNELLITRKE